MLSRIKKYFAEELENTLVSMVNAGQKFLLAIIAIFGVVTSIMLVVALVEGIQDASIRRAVGLFLWILVAGAALPVVVALWRAATRRW